MRKNSRWFDLDGQIRNAIRELETAQYEAKLVGYTDQAMLRVDEAEILLEDLRAMARV